MQKTIDLNLIHTFLVVTDTLSYTKAAAQLGVTQPAISASIKRLEEASKKKLFVKNGRGIELTSTGQELLPKFYNAIN
ncbi:LysR family transcriptional regulator, partial [Vibrio parahaemolyticus]